MTTTSNQPFVGQMVQFHDPRDQQGPRQGPRQGPLAACIVCVLPGGRHVRVAGWDRLGQPWQQDQVHFGGPALGGGAYCLPLPLTDV